MAQLYFYYSAMNAGKSTNLLQSAYNYRERGMTVLILTAEIDDRVEKGKVSSRIGLEMPAELFNNSTDLYQEISAQIRKHPVHCVLVDECQFLTKKQVRQLTDVVDTLGIPVLAFGLRTDFKGDTFEGSHWLLAWADKMIELKTICHCGKKANFVVRMDAEGKPMKQGDQVEIGGDDKYVSMCRQHFKENVWHEDV